MLCLPRYAPLQSLRTNEVAESRGHCTDGFWFRRCSFHNLPDNQGKLYTK